MYSRHNEADSMVDMTLCVSTICKKKEDCWRYTHNSKNVWWQSYSDFSTQRETKASTNGRYRKGCSYFIQNDIKDRDKRNES